MKKLLLASAATALLAGAASAEEIKIGIILGYTGPLESITPAMAQGAELAIAEVNAAGTLLDGATVTGIRGDDGCIDAGLATATAERLITGDGINAWVEVADERAALIALAAMGIRVAPGTATQ